MACFAFTRQTARRWTAQKAWARVTTPAKWRLKTERGTVTAWTYVATDKRPGLLPYSWYLQHVLIGAEAFRLPPDHIASIRSLPSVADPDTARHAMELSIYTPR